MTTITKWIVHTKLLALWYIITSRPVIYGVYFDADHPLNLAPRNLTPDTLVTGCEFDGPGALLQNGKEDRGIIPLHSLHYQGEVK